MSKQSVNKVDFESTEQSIESIIGMLKQHITVTGISKNWYMAVPSGI